MRQTQLHAYILIAMLGVALAGILSAKPLTLSGRPKTDFGMIPMAMDGWNGVRGGFDAQTKKLLPSCSLLHVPYTNLQRASAVELAVVYGTDLGDFHQPETCLQGSGLRILSKRTVLVGLCTGCV